MRQHCKFGGREKEFKLGSLGCTERDIVLEKQNIRKKDKNLEDTDEGQRKTS